MAKFCVNCGRPLQEGEVCNCTAQQPPVEQAAPQQPVQQYIPQQPPVQQAAPQQPVQQYIPQQQPVQQSAPQPAVPAQPAAPSPAATYFKNMWDIVLGVVKTPAATLKSFAASGDTKTAIGFIAAYSILLSLFMLVLASKIGSLFSGLFSMFSSSSIKWPMAKIFFLTLIMAAGLAFLFAAILLLFNKTVFKADTTYAKMLCVASAKSLAAAPFIAVGILIGLIYVSWGIVFISFGMLLAYFFVAAALKGASEIDDDKALFTLFLSFAVLLIATYIVVRIGFPSCLPSYSTSALFD